MLRVGKGEIHRAVSLATEDGEEEALVDYDWIDLAGPKGYGGLKDVLDEVFDPTVIAEQLRDEVTDAVKFVLVEHGYVDKDYRSTLYSFYAKKGRPYRRDCARLHFFDGRIGFDVERTDFLCRDVTPGDCYYGYIVLRPTMIATLGRSVLAPGIRVGAGGRAIQSEHNVNLLGYVLPVWGFPSMEQPADIAVCAHVSCWAILRYYSERFPQYREYLINDMARLASPFDPGGLVPSLGLTVWEAERVFKAAGCFPLIVAKKQPEDQGEGDGEEASEEEEDLAFYEEMLAYLESGFPLFVEMRRRLHAVVLVGCDWHEGSVALTRDPAHAWDQVNTLLMVDDNRLPYRSVPASATSTLKSEEGDYSGEQFDKFIVALPEKIHFSASAVGALSDSLAKVLIDGRRVVRANVRIRRYFMTTVSELREEVREHASQMGDVLTGLFMRLNSAQYVWVVEFCGQDQWDRGAVAARAIVDATASRQDPVATLLLHDEQLAIVFDRSSGRDSGAPVDLRRPHRVPLPRMELNLRPVLRHDTGEAGD